MDNLGILIQAILSLKDTEASKKQIIKELPLLERNLQSDENARVKIIAGLDIDKSRDLIQAQLDTLANQTKTPTIKVGVDVKSQNSIQNTANGLKNVQSQAQQTAESVKQAMTEITSENISSKTVSEFQKAFNIIGQNAKDTQQTFKGLFAELNNAWYAGDEEKYLNVLEQIYNIAQNTTKVVNKSKSEIKELTDQIRSDFTDSSTAFISPKTKEELKYLLEDSKKIKRVLDSVFGVGKWTYNQNKGVGTDVLANDIKELQGNANEILEVYEKIQNIKSSTQYTVFDSLGGDSASKDAINEHLHNVLNLQNAYRDLQGIEHTYIQGWGWFETLETETENIRKETTAIESQTKATKELKAVRESITRDANGQQIGRTSVSGDTGFTRTSRYDENDNLTSYTETQNFQNIEKSLAKASVEATKLQTKLDSVKSKYSDINAAKPIKNSEHIQQLEKQYNAVQQAIENVKNSDTNAMAQMKANAESEIKKLENLVDSYRKAENPATSLRTKDLGTNISIQTQELDRFINKISKNKQIFNAMSSDITKLKTSLSNITNAESFTKYLNELDIAKSKAESLTTMYQTIGGYDKQLDKLAEDWKKQGIYVGNLKTTIESLKSSLTNVTNTDELSSWVNGFDTQIGKISQLPVQISKCKQELSLTTSEWEKQHLYVGKIAEKSASLGRSISGIRKPEKFDEWVKEWTNLNSQVSKLKINLDSQVEHYNEIYKIQAKINSLDPNKNSNEIAKLQESLSLEEKKISNLQFQSNVYGNLISKEEKENYILKNTAEAREKLNTSFTKLEDKSIQSQTQQLKDYGNQIDKAVSKLNSLQNSNVFSKNASNPQVAQIKQDLSNLIKEYQKLMTQMQGDITPAGLETLGSELNKLNTRFNSACVSAEQFKRELKDDNGSKKLAQNVSVLTARIEAYRKANAKSEKLFGGEYDRILSQLSNPNIDWTEYNRLNKEFQKLRLEINEADKSGKNLWQTFKEKLTKFTGWMSMTYAVTLFTSNVRSAVSELKEMDSILTEISKTSDRTEESLKKLGKDSFTTASKYGRTASDYLLGVQEMSRAGFGEKESEQMAELSLLAQSAGDMTAELANEYLIATNAGYQLGGSAEKLNSVLDSQNFITNRNALNMSELAEATKIVSSQAAQSGIGIDEMTAAVGTMIATTQQGGEVAARSLKGILMNLQAVKGTAEEIGDGGEDITDESLTKYEKACLDLGVALKEVKNGITVLRDPMKILEELASAVAKESEDSIKVANLISAVGGKYRGGQLAALLRNWETYSKMLSEFNSQEAVNSAFEESTKSANNWEGSLNKLSNEWNKFVNNFANSDMMIKGIDSITQIIELVEKLTSTLGTLPTILGGVTAALSAKNVGELQNKNTPVSIQPQIICIEDVTRLKIRLSNCWDDYAKAL